MEFQKYNVKKKKKKNKNKERKQANQQKQCRKNYKENTGTKLISNTKKHILEILSRVWNCRYTMLYKRRRERNRGEKKVTEIMKKTIGTKLITYTKRLKLKI